MSHIEMMGNKLYNAQQRVSVLARNAEEFLTQPDLLSTVLEELAVILEEVEQQYEEMLITRQTLERQRQRYQELFDFAPDGYLVTDVHGGIQEANHSAASLFGIAQTFLVNKPLAILVAEEHRQAFRNYLSRLKTTPQQRHWDFQFKSRQGRVFPAVITTSAIRAPDGTLEGWRWLIRDITELKQAMSSQQLSLSGAGADDLRSNFVQVVSHELRTPMTIIVTSLELLMRYNTERTGDTRQQAYLDRIHQAIWRMNTLINDVLLYADVTTEAIVFNPTLFDLETLCIECVHKQRDHDHGRHLITVNTSGACNAVWADRALIQQMLDCLLSNAVTYSPDSTTVRVRVHCEHDRTCLSVHNEGTYLPPEEQAKIFEPFYRPEHTIHKTGIGLGLTFVKRAVDQHGGELSVESSIEAGTTFSISLPTRERSSQP